MVLLPDIYLFLLCMSAFRSLQNYYMENKVFENAHFIILSK